MSFINDELFGRIRIRILVKTNFGQIILTSPPNSGLPELTFPKNLKANAKI